MGKRASDLLKKHREEEEISLKCKESDGRARNIAHR
jgi:hypothetical protein